MAALIQKRNKLFKKENGEMSKIEQFGITVEIGASAGGLEAFKVFFECLPVDTGLSFVVIQHLATGQESMLTDILSRFTKIARSSSQRWTHVEPDHVYVIPLEQL